MFSSDLDGQELRGWWCSGVRLEDHGNGLIYKLTDSLELVGAGGEGLDMSKKIRIGVSRGRGEFKSLLSFALLVSILLCILYSNGAYHIARERV